MKKVKLVLGLIIIIFTGLVIYQNRIYFMTKTELSLSLGVETWHWTAPGVENVYFFAGCLVIGLLFAGFMGISSKLKSNKTIKSLNSTIESHLEMISSLRNELDAYKSASATYKTESAADVEVEVTEDNEQQTKKETA